MADCPKCGQKMYTTGGGYNYNCAVCGYSYHASPPRSSGTSDAIDRFNQAYDRCKESEKEVRRAQAEMNDFIRSMKITGGTGKTKGGKKGSCLGNIIGWIIILLIVGYFLS